MKKRILFTLSLATIIVSSVQSQDLAEKNNNIDAQAEVGIADDGRASTKIWKNNFTTTKGLATVQYKAAPKGKQNLIAADDFIVPVGKQWQIDTLQTYLYWGNAQPNSYIMRIYGNDTVGGYVTGKPGALIKTTTFTANLPNPLTAYFVKIAMPQILTAGQYWYSVVGVYDTVGSLHSNAKIAYWSRKDTLLGTSAAAVADSIGIYYTAPTSNWKKIYFASPENPYNSLRFLILGTETSTSGITSKLKYDNGSIAAYPNPANSSITFKTDNAQGKYVDIYDITGKLIETTELNNYGTVLNVNSYSDGIYFYQLKGKNNDIIDTGKFTIAK